MAKKYRMRVSKPKTNPKTGQIEYTIESYTFGRGWENAIIGWFPRKAEADDLVKLINEMEDGDD